MTDGDRLSQEGKNEGKKLKNDHKVYFSTFTWYCWKLSFTHRVVGGQLGRKGSQKKSPGLPKGGGGKNKICSAGLRPKHPQTLGKAGSQAALRCETETMLRSLPIPTAGLHFVCYWKLLWFSLHVSVSLIPMPLSLHVPQPIHPPPIAVSFSSG